ncbi:MAG: glycine dehydrogenase (aminomethyl-transferring), partial [Gemmatimonadota bacterium]|nr:glycine dehydrogenase (aminomethyl-transferring) [Gemmatimonadota bacterium]
MTRLADLPERDRFVDRHVGPRPDDVDAMLEALGQNDLEAFCDAVVPPAIRHEEPLDLPQAATESEALGELRAMASKNDVWRSMIGMGYHDTITPPVILRNVLENPGWYTAYTPYQAEIAQGRLEALLAFQTVVQDLTGLEVANASLLDEGTAAAEALTMAARVTRKKAPVFLVDEACHPQTIAVVETRAEAQGIETVVTDVASAEIGEDVAGVLVQYPDTEGRIADWSGVAERAHEVGALVVAATDLLALTMMRAPAAWGADVAVGNSQRFGVPLGYGGPHAAFFATREEFVRQVPGRIIGVTRDAGENDAYRMALQTREQHIRKEKATSNVCTAQVLLAVIAGLYAVWHGPEGLTAIARRVHGLATLLADGLERLGLEVVHDAYFDTLTVSVAEDAAGAIHGAATERRINLRRYEDGRIGVALDETTTPEDVRDLLAVFHGGETPDFELDALEGAEAIPADHVREQAFLEHPVFHRYRSETEMLRYLKRLENRDFSLAHGMIPLGSCTMKLNATTEMIPITWKEFGALHPFAPREQAAGYAELFDDLEEWLAEITGFEATSLQPNAGSQGELAGLLVIRAWHRSRGEDHRTT